MRLNGWLRLWIVWSVGVLAVLGFALYVGLASSDVPAAAQVRDAVGGVLLWSVGPLLAGYAVAWIRRGFAGSANDASRG